MGNEQTKSGVTTGFGIHAMDEQLQRRFSKGVQFNMKIAIRGDRNSGKTCLFNRLQGKPFVESYIPTDEIQVCSIMWSYKETQDTVKVEVWDIVDKGKSQKKKSDAKLKLFNEPDVESPTDQPLDAQFLDVYQGTHGVIFLFDMTKQWTFKYVLRELPLVPYHIPVVVLGNFRDMGEHRVVSSIEAVNHLESMERPEGSANIRYCEASMKDGFGLIYLHKFFSLPFLHLQQETLLRQLQVNRELIQSALDELTANENSEDQNYELFKENLAAKAQERQQKKMAAAAASKSAVVANPDTVSDSTKPTENPKEASQVKTTQPTVAAATTTTTSKTSIEPPPATTRKSSFKERLSQKFSTKKASPSTSKKEQQAVKKAQPAKAAASGAVNIDNFVPEEQIDANFLTDDENDDNKLLDASSDDDSDSNINPLVAADEDVSSVDEGPKDSSNGGVVINKAAVESANEDGDVDEDADSDVVVNQVLEDPPLSDDEQQIEDTSVKQKESPVLEKKEEEKPISAPKPVSKRPALLSAKSVTITESSSSADEDESGALVQSSSKKKAPVTKKPAAMKEPRPAPKSTGLMLEHSVPKKPSPAAVLKEPEATPEGKKDKDSGEKKTKSKKKRRHKEQETEAAAVDSKPSTASAANDDPFSSSLLDAWLGSSTEPLDPVLQPVSSKSVTEEALPEETKKQKQKKHKQKHRRSEGEEKKKHRHHKHTSSTGTADSVETTGNDYVALL